MTVTPDIAGFMAASRQMRELFGSPVTFKVPQDPVWPAGTAINPDTNQPYDAMIVRTNPPDVEIVKTCLLILKEGSPLRPQSDVRYQPVGVLEAMDIILDVDSADWPDVSSASDFTVNSKTYVVEEFKPFSLNGQLYRYLVYGAEH
jgi:hypothetical protein